MYEPAMPVSRAVVSDEAYDRYCAAVEEGRIADAVRISVDDIIGLNDDEGTLFLLPAVVERCAPILAPLMRELPELDRPIDSSALQRLTMPVLLLGGARSGHHFIATLQRLNEILPNARIANIPDAGHVGPLTHAEAVARELVSFLKT
jgi:pimeloyl-ACP methyl ester carboxylesterase